MPVLEINRVQKNGRFGEPAITIIRFYFMNNIQVFLTVRIRDTGRLAAIGNFFLAPARYLFSGKSIAVMEDGITEIPSFSRGRTINARRDSTLQSTDTDIGYGEPFLYWIGFTVAVIPGIILGSIFKGLSYIKNPIAQKNHTLVKEKLTPKDMRIEFSQDQKADSKSIEACLRDYSLTGQHTRALIISNDEKDSKEDVILDDKCVNEIIHHISPYKLILNKKIKADEKQFRSCSDWNSKALKFFAPNPERQGDYAGYGGDANTISSEARQEKSEVSSYFTFLKPKQNKIPGVLSSIEDALKEPEPSFWRPDVSSHTVYVIK